ncbi:MAG: Ig-like domain-containing protein [Treponema sp.]|nr:Ig-like domain-containing protein [Treponema sp.]MEE3434106.1 Ig-like domain-containing protein [Treponema sp.]
MGEILPGGRGEETLDNAPFYGLMKKLLLLTGFILFLFADVASLFARDVTERAVENMNSWQENFDLENKKGKYNVIVTARDKGGNTTYGGPFNIFIDPKSDLPIIGITNPEPNLRVPGNLNIVGTCLDDDAVDYVELILDGAEPVRAKGKEFWSYFIDTSNMEEGNHTIEAYGVDINGVKGNTVKNVWCLDRKVPLTEVTNFTMGTLVSGTIHFEGTVEDGNGVTAMDFSVDEGATFETIKLKHEKKSPNATFDFNLDTRKMPDGPAVMWFFAHDSQGSIGFYPFLLFVDNTKPKINIAFPQEKVPVKGAFAAAGSANDTVGLKSLTWEYNGEKGDFEIIAGNPYWVHEFPDVKKNKNGKLTITAVDTAGNVSSETRNVVIDPNGDKPLVRIDWPQAGAALGKGEEMFVRGIATDDDNVKAVRIVLDGSELGVIETQSVFYKSLIDSKSLGGGAHKVSVSAIDIYDVEGPAAVVEFKTTGEKPYFNGLKISGGTAAGPVNYGSLISPEQGGNLEIEAASAAGFANAWFIVSKGGSKGEQRQLSVSEKDAKKIFSIPISELPWGVVELKFHVEDTLGREADYSTCVYVANLTDIKADDSFEIAESVQDERLTARIATVNGEEYKCGMRIVASPDPKAAPVTIELDIQTMETAIVGYKVWGQTRPGERASYEAKSITLSRLVKGEPAQRGVISLTGLPARATNIEITVQIGKDYTQKFGGQILIAREHDESDIEDTKKIFWATNGDTYYNEDAGTYVLPHKTLTAYVNAPGPITASVVGGWAGMSASVEGNVVTLSCDNGGTFRGVQIRAVDANGKSYTSQAVNLVVSEDGPVFDIKAPEFFAWVRNSLRVQGTVSDPAGVTQLEYSLDNGENWSVIPFRTGAQTVNIYVDINLTEREEGLVPLDIRAKNTSGLISYYRSAVCKDVTPPEAKIVVPEAEAVLNGINTIAILASDNGALAKTEYGSPTSRDGRAGVRRSQIPLTIMPHTIVGDDDLALDQTMSFIVTDAAGNETKIEEFEFKVDRESDLPVVQIQLPFENQVITKDFTISGVVLDDDGPCTVAYRIDKGPFKPAAAEPSYSFKIDVPISEMTDNEHIIYMYAMDINGVRGRTVEQKFRVSLAEPVCEMTSPDINTTQKEIVSLKGTASDKNGIKSVEVSLDNGNSYNLAEGTTNWTYTFDTRVLPDGTHVVFIRTTDNYDITSLYSSQINTDNTKPEINLELPLDDSQTSGPLFFSGFTLDNISLEELTLTITSLDGRAVPSSFRNRKMSVDRVITETIDMTPLENGLYNVKLTGIDAAGNQTSVSRNVTLDKRIAAASVDIYYPLNGERKQGAFTIVGSVRAERKIEKLNLYFDDKVVAETTPSVTNYYKFSIEEGQFEEGLHSYFVRATLEGGATIDSIKQTVDYNAYGPWVRIENFDYGDFAYDRPTIKGTAGYSISEAEMIASKKKGGKDLKEDISLRKVESVELSLNNGRTFTQISKKAKWSFRIENDDLAEGYHFLLIRAKMANGEIAVTRCIVQIDKTAPFVRIIAPGVGGRYNQNLVFSGLANDDVGLSEVKLALRKGDKNSYGVPKFIQGLYIDTSFWGATLFDIGLGLTFFDDNVRVQFNWGQFTQTQRDIFRPGSPMRYGGSAVLGFKIIANVANLPFGWMFGHDWDWLSANFAIGASFKYFNETASGKGQMLSAVITQIEFPRMHFAKFKCFKTISAYTEFQLWFIPTDTSGIEVSRVVFQYSFGLRTNVF